jgi:predicted GNAT family N-acyltransferase
MIWVGVVAFGSEEYLAAVELRREVLRRPLGLDYTSEQLSTDIDKTIVVAKDESGVIGSLMLTDEGSGDIRMRAVAVAEARRQEGIGRQMAIESERSGRQQGFSRMILHARDVAVEFYRRMGYEVEGDEFIEVTIPHRFMQKSLV